MKTDALPAAVVVALRPAHRGVVSAEFGERRRAGNGIRHVIVAAVGMRDGVPANRTGATLKSNDLALKAIARQDDAATVREERSAVLSRKEQMRRKSFARKCPKSFAADAVIVLIDRPFIRPRGAG